MSMPILVSRSISTAMRNWCAACASAASTCDRSRTFWPPATMPSSNLPTPTTPSAPSGCSTHRGSHAPASGAGGRELEPPHPDHHHAQRDAQPTVVHALLGSRRPGARISPPRPHPAPTTGCSTHVDLLRRRIGARNSRTDERPAPPQGVQPNVVRAPASGAGGRELESPHPDHHAPPPSGCSTQRGSRACFGSRGRELELPTPTTPSAPLGVLNPTWFTRLLREQEAGRSNSPPRRGPSLPSRFFGAGWSSAPSSTAMFGRYGSRRTRS